MMFQQLDFHDFCALSYNPSKTMQIYENSTTKAIVLSIIFIKKFRPSLTIHPPYPFNLYNVTQLQRYKVTRYNLVKGYVVLLEWKEKQAGWKLEWKRRKVEGEKNVKIVLI